MLLNFFHKQLAFNIKLKYFHNSKSLIVLFLLFVFNNISYSQQLPFSHLSISDGLEDTVIFSIEQDQLGFLWIATRTGINRFDGEKFWTYGQNDGLPHNLARDLLIAKDGTLWVASERGIAWFDGKKFHGLYGENGWPENTPARDIVEAKDGSIWVASYGDGIYHIQTGSSPKIIGHFNKKSGLPSNRIRSLFIDSDENIWLGMSKNVVRIKNNIPKIIQWDGSKTEIRAFYQHTDGSIWAGTRRGLIKFNGKSFDSFDLGDQLKAHTINTILKDNKGFIWIGTRDFGVYKFDKDFSYKHYDMLDGLPDNSINTVFQDNESNIWFGTYGAGVSRLSTSKVLNWKAQTGMPNPNVYAIANDHNGCLWIGTNGNGVSSLCDKQLKNYTTAQGLSHNKVLSIMIDKNNTPWFGTLKGYSHFESGGFKNFGEDGYAGMVNYHIIQASDNSIWLGTNNGLNHIQDGQSKQYTTSNGLPDNRINRIIESDGKLWLASANGLTRFDGKNFKNWTTTDGLPANFINDFYEDEKGGLWIATNNGLSYFYDNKFTNWTTKDGLPHNNCTVILPGENNDIWIGTNRGVAIFNGEDFTVITSREGLVFDLINRGAGFKDSQGNLWFGTGEGISKFFKDFTPGSSTAPPIHLLSVSNNDIPLDLHKKAKIPQKNSALAFNFSAISFQRSPDVNYRYKLDNGENTQWRKTRLRELQINSLAEGDYQFIVTARIGKGKWYKNPAVFRFTVTPPFWQTSWFIFLAIMAIIAAFVYKNYLNKQKAIELENLVKQRTKQLEEMNEDLKWHANHDDLTRLANRKHVKDYLQSLQADKNANFGIIIIDLDYFKRINDEYGHAGGDLVLEKFALLLKNCTSKQQLAARWGGEEFLIICPNMDLSAIYNLSENILNECRNLTVQTEDKQHIKINCSVGFSLTSTHDDKSYQWEKMIHLADIALYDAKNNGRDCGVGYITQSYKNIKNWQQKLIKKDVDVATKAYKVYHIIINNCQVSQRC